MLNQCCFSISDCPRLLVFILKVIFQSITLGVTLLFSPKAGFIMIQVSTTLNTRTQFKKIAVTHHRHIHNLTWLHCSLNSFSYMQYASVGSGRTALKVLSLSLHIFMEGTMLPQDQVVPN